MVSTSGNNVSGLSWDQGAVRVSHQAWEGSKGWDCWDGGSISRDGSRDGSPESGALGGKVVGTGSHNSGFVSWDDGTVRVSHQWGGDSPWGSRDGASDGSHWETLSSKVVGAGSDNSGLVSGDDGAVRVGHKAKRPLRLGGGDSHGRGEDSLEKKANE